MDSRDEIMGVCELCPARDQNQMTKLELSYHILQAHSQAEGSSVCPGCPFMAKQRHLMIQHIRARVCGQKTFFYSLTRARFVRYEPVDGNVDNQWESVESDRTVRPTLTSMTPVTSAAAVAAAITSAAAAVLVDPVRMSCLFLFGTLFRLFSYFFRSFIQLIVSADKSSQEAAIDLSTATQDHSFVSVPCAYCHRVLTSKTEFVEHASACLIAFFRTYPGVWDLVRRGISGDENIGE